MAKPGIAFGLGPKGRGFKSRRPDAWESAHVHGVGCGARAAEPGDYPIRMPARGRSTTQKHRGDRVFVALAVLLGVGLALRVWFLLVRRGRHAAAP